MIKNAYFNVMKDDCCRYIWTTFFLQLKNNVKQNMETKTFEHSSLY